MVSVWGGLTAWAALPLQSGSLSEATDSVDIDPVVVLWALVVLVIAYALGQIVSTGLNEFADRFLANRFRVTTLIPLVKFLIYGTALYVVVTLLFELSSTQLVAFSGLLGAALGLGLKDLLADVVGGLVLIAEQPYQIGDKISIGEYYGEVVNIGIRSTQVLTPNDTLVSVPNYIFFNDSVANANAGQAEMLVTVDFYIDPESDARRARRIVEDALISSQYVYITDEYPIEVHMQDDLHYRTITGKAYINDLRNELRFKTDVTDRVFKEFSRQGIHSPKVPAGVEGEGME
jgi:small-conductance mechanosensitive channel